MLARVVYCCLALEFSAAGRSRQSEPACGAPYVSAQEGRARFRPLSTSVWSLLYAYGCWTVVAHENNNTFLKEILLDEVVNVNETTPHCSIYRSSYKSTNKTEMSRKK
ncbi:hypothetical protein Y032_0075g976 [Ancylostoma ceylanicum]|uniref:Uncharacterized protein n=1 Tax=Ancylostoma ceylanicum TaxID=53326 RepID=A0A016TVF6_9BILA|nr:hypothetical protein Y032_0075g976 [Ancylostoma ceylanicum]